MNSFSSIQHPSVTPLVIGSSDNVMFQLQDLEHKNVKSIQQPAAPSRHPITR